MRRDFKRGKNLIVDGPASIHILSGNISILGAILKNGAKVLIRDGKSVPLEVIRDADLELTLGENASFAETDEKMIMDSWKDAVNEILILKKPLSILVIGKIDTGKTSFCTYLANSALEAGHKVAVIDGDLGQSDIGPPATMGLSYVREPIIDLYGLQMDNAVFVGVTSPSRATVESVNALVTLKNKALKMNVDFLIINTDGWVEGEDAVNYKARLIEAVAPDAILCLQEGDELKPLLNKIRRPRVFIAEPPKTIKNRSREARKVLRELAYKKYLREAKVRCYPLSSIKIEGGFLKPNIQSRLERKRKLEEILGMKLLHYEETRDKILIVTEKEQPIYTEQIERLGDTIEKHVIIFREEDEEGLLVALENEQGEYLGIGVLCEVDFNKKTLKVYTSVDGKVSSIQIGQVKLNKKGSEIGCEL